MYRFEFFRDRQNMICLEEREELAKEKHFHNCIEFIYAIDGEACAHVDGTEYRFSSGQICAVSCFATHDYEIVRNGRFLVCLIPRRYFREHDHIFNNRSFQRPIVSDGASQPLRAIFDQIRCIAYDRNIWGEPLDKVDPDYQEQQLYHLCNYLVNLFIDHCGLYERKRISSLVADAVGIIETHFKEPINVATICTMLNCSQKDLSFNFKKTMNLTILEYIQRTRLLEATRLLRQHPNLTNDMIMLEAGYQSTRTFLRHFEASYHCTPAEYKKKNTKN